jgi:hypothetical protein
MPAMETLNNEQDIWLSPEQVLEPHAELSDDELVAKRGNRWLPCPMREIRL